MLVTSPILHLDDPQSAWYLLPGYEFLTTARWLRAELPIVLFLFFISMTSSAYLISHLLFGSVLVSVLDTSQASDVLVAAGIGKIQW